ncbi:hypothetical protein T10_4405 [Trichinella papuae]|uniref:Uncharacterized protein n=1 Tax=Trichinella papuae TaxID=268474 RepID=A0A0V1M2W3_9BILA|nr:hypothetical protein T10_4405 [Trichinella papuae]
MDTLIQQVLSGSATVGDLRQVNRVYVKKQQLVAHYTVFSVFVVSTLLMPFTDSVFSVRQWYNEI